MRFNLKKISLKKLIFTFAIIFTLSLLTIYLIQYAQVSKGAGEALKWCKNHKKIIILSSFFISFIYLLIISLVGNITSGSIAGFIIFAILAFANAKKLSILGEPIYPSDFYQLLEIKSLLKFITGYFSLLYLIIAAILIFVFVKLYKRFPKLHLSFVERIMSFILSIFMIYSYLNFNSNFLKNISSKAGVRKILANQLDNYSQNGFVIAVLSNLQNDIMPKPQGYSKEAVLKIAEKYKEKAAEINKTRQTGLTVKPNIIYVMDESFWDPTKLSSLTFSEDPMKNIRNIMSKYSSGALLSTDFGGHTANIEFEALTGFSYSFLLSGTVPYQQAFQNNAKVPSLVSILESENYDTVAIHPYTKVFYKRNRVYPALGFDNFIGQDEVKYKDRLTKNAYISDQSVVNEILYKLKEDNNPQFIHAVTMQNHLPFTYGKHGINSISISGLSDDLAKELETYSEGIKQTDIAMKNLIDELSKLHEPTIVAFWGDHLPGLTQSIYDEADYPNSSSKLENEKALSETPLFIYSNFNMDRKDLKTLSPAFLGVTIFDMLNKPLTPYYTMLEEVKSSLPGLKSSVLVDNNGNIKSNLSESEKQLLEDYKLIEYDLLLGKQYSLSVLFNK